MAYGDTYTPEPILSLPAAAALAALTFVSVNSSGQFAQTATGARPVGILPRAATGVNDQVRAYLGPYGSRMKATAGGTIAAGASVAVGANGKLVTAASTNFIVGVALEAAASGDHASFLWQPGGVAP